VDKTFKFENTKIGGIMDIENKTIQFKCPNCGIVHSVTLNNITAGKSIKCACGKIILLNDKNGSLKKVSDEISKFKKMFGK
jgi:predicted RNA-binding Zn-ribbon protein involved in translation (DUF1610 family)